MREVANPQSTSSSLLDLADDEKHGARCAYIRNARKSKGQIESRLRRLNAAARRSSRPLVPAGHAQCAANGAGRCDLVNLASLQ